MACGARAWREAPRFGSESPPDESAALTLAPKARAALRTARILEAYRHTPEPAARLGNRLAARVSAEQVRLSESPPQTPRGSETCRCRRDPSSNASSPAR